MTGIQGKIDLTTLKAQLEGRQTIMENVHITVVDGNQQAQTFATQHAARIL